MQIEDLFERISDLVWHSSGVGVGVFFGQNGKRAHRFYGKWNSGSDRMERSRLWPPEASALLAVTFSVDVRFAAMGERMARGWCEDGARMLL